MSGSSRWASKPAEMSSQRRREALDDRRDHLVERLEVHVAGRPRRQRDVDGRPVSCTGSRLGAPPRARIQRPLVGADEQHPRVVVEHRLGAVAVMRVEVEDPHPLAGVGERGSDDGDVRHQAETHRVRRRGVVARRPHGAERGGPLAASQRGHGGQTGAGGEHRGRRRLGARRRVGVDPPAARRRQVLEPIEVPRRVDALELGALRPAAVRGRSRPRRARAVELPRATAARRDGRSG